MHLLFVLFDFTIVFCFAWDDYVASFCNSPLSFWGRAFPGRLHSISRIEIGTRFVTDYEIRELSKILKVTPAWLLGME